MTKKFTQNDPIQEHREKDASLRQALADIDAEVNAQQSVDTEANAQESVDTEANAQESVDTESETTDETPEKKTRNRKRKECYNPFEAGLEAAEIPTAVLDLKLTRTEYQLYMCMSLYSDRKTGRLHSAKISHYTEWLGCSRGALYTALASLNEKNVISTEIHGWITGTVLMRPKKQSGSNKNSASDTGNSLSKTLVHREALRIMCQKKIPPLATRVYLKLGANIDLQTGRIHTEKIKKLATEFDVTTGGIYKAIRQLNDAGLTGLVVDYGVTGHLPLVALANSVIKLVIEAKKDAANQVIGYKSKLKKYRVALYKAFGIPSANMTEEELLKHIEALKERLAEHVPAAYQI